MNKAINITELTKVDSDKFVEEFNSLMETEVNALLEKLDNKEDENLIQDVSMKMMALYQQMYFVNEEERESIQRQLNNYKSVIASVSARYQLDFANTIINVCKKASVLALSTAVSFVSL